MSAPVASIYLRVPGEPRGQKRARHGKGFTYTDDDQEQYAQTIQGVWLAAGRPVLIDGPYRVEVVAWMGRPKTTHYRKDGSLSAAGLASPRPTKRPDCDNFLKQLDALVAVGAVPDDALAVEMRVSKWWARQPHRTVQEACLEFYLTSLVPEQPTQEVRP